MLNAEKYNLYDYSKDVNFILQFADYLSIDKSPSTVKTYKNNIIYFFKFIIKQDNDYSIAAASEKDYLKDHARIIVNLMREDRSLSAKTIIRTRYNRQWICKNQLLPLLDPMGY